MRRFFRRVRDTKRWERAEAIRLAKVWLAARNAYMYADYPLAYEPARRRALRQAESEFTRACACYFLGEDVASLVTARSYQLALRETLSTPVASELDQVVDAYRAAGVA